MTRACVLADVSRETWFGQRQAAGFPHLGRYPSAPAPFHVKQRDTPESCPLWRPSPGRSDVAGCSPVGDLAGSLEIGQRAAARGS